jgi:hypothetical protein
MRGVPIGFMAVMLIGGCEGSGPTGSSRLKPEDFSRAAAEQLVEAAESRPADDASPAETAQVSSVAAAPSDPAPAESLSERAEPLVLASAAPRDVIIDGMVGQIRGKPVFASEVFREIGDTELTRLGQTLPRLEFQRRAEDLINRKLSEWIYNRLELTEAERALTERERQALAGMRKMRREEIIARYGGGVPALADQALMDRFGYNVEQLVEQDIQRQIILYYRQKKIKPKIFVNRREVERYFQDHQDQFNPPPTVTVRVIIVRDTATAEQVDAALAEGASFPEVASRYSVFRRNDGGLLSPFPLKGSLADFNELGWPQLNEKVRRLKAGEHSDRTPLGDNFGWVMLADLKTSEPRKLEDVFLQVERMLRQEKERNLHQSMMRDLLKKENFTPPEQMAGALLRVAMSRYARQ